MSFSVAVLNETKRLIDEEMGEEAKILALGNVSDYASYREKVGRLYAYRRVIELFDEAESKLEKRG